MQRLCMAALMELAEEDKNVLYLTADSGEGGLDLMFRNNFPKQAIEFGIAEENMVAAAAGLALAGKVPFIYAPAPFLVYRAYEFIRDDICLQNQHVIMLGTGSGLSVSSLGPTHHSTEDFGVLRTLPELTILSPSTPKQAYECIRKAYEMKGPVYIRVGMNKEPEYMPENYKWKDRGYEIIREGANIVFLSTGTVLQEVVEAAEKLSELGITAKIVDVYKLKPFPEDELLDECARFNVICTVEEHNINGGLGSAVAEIMQKSTHKSKVVKIGLQDSSSVGYGTLQQVRKENCLDAEFICKKIEEICNERV